MLYSYWRSSSSYRVRIALYLKKVDYEYHPIHLVKHGGEQHKPIYHEVNPMAEVPFLIDDKMRISQSMAILHYLDEAYPEPRLFPKNLLAHTKCLELCEIINSGIQPIQNLKVLNELKLRFHIEDQQKIDWMHYWMDRGFKAFEWHLKHTSGQYCIGDKITAADVYLIPQVYNALRFNVDMTHFPLISKVAENCMKLGAFKKAEPAAQPDAEEIKLQAG